MSQVLPDTEPKLFYNYELKEVCGRPGSSLSLNGINIWQKKKKTNIIKITVAKGHSKKKKKQKHKNPYTKHNLYKLQILTSLDVCSATDKHEIWHNIKTFSLTNSFGLKARREIN